MPSVVLSFEGKVVSTVELTRDRYTIGRSEDCDIQVENLGVSRHHATLVRTESGYAVEDAGSVNGVFVNGEKVSLQPLRDKDEILMGKYLLLYRTLAKRDRESTVISTLKMDEDTIRKRMRELNAKKRQNPES